MAKYDPISEFLRGATSPVTLKFAELDRLVGGLPPSARNHRSWWGNTHHEMHVHAKAWVSVGWVVADLDLHAERVTFARGVVDERPRLSSTVWRATGRPRPRSSSGPDGAAQLAVVLKQAGYPTTLHAVAAHTSMLDPAVVAQTQGQAVFASVRRDVRSGERVGSFGDVDGVRVMLDDNLSPTVAFLWAAGHSRGVDMQYNHIWTASRDRAAYTALWNLCATPAFLAKTTDGNNHPEVVAALRRRVLPSCTGMCQLAPPFRRHPTDSVTSTGLLTRAPWTTSKRSIASTCRVSRRIV